MSDVPSISQNFARPSYRPAQPARGDGDLRRMGIIAAAIGGSLALVVGMFSLSHHVHHGVPIVLAPPGPVRVKPVNPGGMQVAGAEDLSTGAEMLAPEPEKPALHALRAKIRAAEKPAAPKVAEAAPAVAPARPVQQAAVAAPIVAAAPPVQRASISEPAEEPRGTTVQLAAFETQAAAEQDWGKLSEKIPGLFDGRKPVVERAVVAGRTVYRLRTGGFANLAAATEFCGKVRAKGGDCTIAAF
jgi:hypothetical protein